MTRRYNLRKRDPKVKWIEDEDLKEEETESDDEDYEPSLSDDEEDEDMDEEEEEETESDEEEEETTQNITIPLPKKGMRVSVSIEIEHTGGSRSRYDEDDMEEDEEEEEDEFIDYLMNKYVPSNRVKQGGGKNKKEEKDEKPPIELSHEEQKYYDDLPKGKKKKMAEQMKQLAKAGGKSEVPEKFRLMELAIPEDIKSSVLSKIDKSCGFGSDSGKYQNWVDGFFRLPFGKYVPLPVTLKDGPAPCAKFLGETRQTLDKAVYGMNSAKTQMMQILAQWIANPSSIGNVIALKGSPGVGKTSFARNGVSKVLHRPFAFFGLGGATDASHYLGHSFTYEGSRWGCVVDTLISKRCMNPVLYFDELDKISTTPQGEEIASMLVHMTDRAQNSQFHDKYFAGIDFDLSQCLFVFSFNDESKINPILKDRMQVIHCPGYSAEEKRIIISQYSIPELLERTSLTGQITIPDATIKHLIEEYSQEEEGVRTLMRSVETLLTRINLLRIADEETAKTYKFYRKITLPTTIDVDTAKHILQDLNSNKGDESFKRMYV